MWSTILHTGKSLTTVSVVQLVLYVQNSSVATLCYITTMDLQLFGVSGMISVSYIMDVKLGTPPSFASNLCFNSTYKFTSY